MLKRFIIKLLCFFCGCSLCFVLHTKFDVSAVVASCIVGLFGTFIPLSKLGNVKDIQNAVYAGSFAGMCSAGVLTHFSQIFFLSLLGASFYLLTIDLFKGYGGKLGTIAFISVSLVYLLKGSLL
ncbi:hypothetical protein HBN50_03000 [Halobacteriovorax sp. GB3]|uniref:hypothetical protein n=1 Tax=Halobacteriovorax sp. GB3 TaxID=2719615 RepID=UPI002360CD07|nr:hypothetical protein [Halobacteriovorax sp. GB3]MDD0852043.1 hypothetical protein [Halobacteriovorax sp. GB3]